MDIQITIPIELEERVTKAMCASAGLPESPENVKQALLNHIQVTVSNVEEADRLRALRESPTENPITLS